MICPGCGLVLDIDLRDRAPEERLRVARQRLADTARELLRGRVRLCDLVQVARGLVCTLEYLSRLAPPNSVGPRRPGEAPWETPPELAVFRDLGREVEKWRR